MGASKDLFLDTATTGLNPPEDRIVEIALLDSEGNRLIHNLVNPQRSIPARVVAMHGISDEMVADAHPLKDLIPALRRRFREAERVVIYNAAFDTRFFPETLWKGIEICCSMQAFIGIYSELEGKYSLQRFPLSKAYSLITGAGIQQLGPRHRALTDCMASRVVWGWCSTRVGWIDSPEWKARGHESECPVCREVTFHRLRPRIRQGYEPFYQCTVCFENHISRSEMEERLGNSNTPEEENQPWEGSTG